MDIKRPVVLVVMDGIGINQDDYGNAVKAAYTPALNSLYSTCPNVQLKAHGTAVGLPSDEDMGNSEVGHNALGCGQIYDQGAKLVNESIHNGKMFLSKTWNDLITNCIENRSVLHFIGLLSDGNVHSNISHLKSMIKRSKEQGVTTVRIHALLDGRDVGAVSADRYISDIESYMRNLNCEDFDCRIASGGGRMRITMDRYEANWDMVSLGWKTHVLGLGRQFDNALQAIETYRTELGVIDQDLPPFVIAKDTVPIGTIQNDDSVVLFNFRGDRAIEISKAFEEKHFDKFDRIRYPKVLFAGMLQYDGDLQLPKNYLVKPPDIKNTLSELLVDHGLKQYAVSETQKFGHVTYFWNGNRSEKFNEKLEIFEEVPSDIVPYEQRPWMKAAEITDKLINAMKSGEYQFLRANFPNGDMVSHTGNFAAAKIAVEAVDLCIQRIIEAVDDMKGILIITADHGNADEMYEKAKGDAAPRAKTSHTLNPVPFILYDKEELHRIKQGSFGLANVAPTIAKLFNLEVPGMWEESM
jgi:2,3-bisphosphoglycerate-independent phosphoglycerate mutase